MILYEVILYLFGIIAAAAALALVFSKNVFYSAMYVIVCLISLAGIYVLSFAEFVAVTQILVYAGGILVIIVFGIMLTAKLGQRPLEVAHGNVLTGLILAVPLFGVLSAGILSMPLETPTVSTAETQTEPIQAIGIALMSDYVLAFEIAGLLLLIALVGAAVVASHKPKVS